MMRTARYLFVLFFALSAVFSFAQTQRTEDSIKALLDVAKTDSAKLELYKTLSNEAASTDAGVKYALEGIKFSEEHNFPKWKLEFIQTAANQYFNGGNYSQALDYYMMEAREIEAGGHPGVGMAAVDLGIGNVYASQNNFSKALEYYKKGLDIILQKGVKGYEGYTITFYENMGGVYIGMQQYDKALVNFNKVLNLLKLNREPGYEFGTTYGSIGSIYEARKSYDTALAYYNRALENYKGIQMFERIATAYADMARVYVEKEEYTAAIPYYDKALDKAIQTHSKEVVVTIYQGYADAYAAEGDYKKAYEYHKKFSAAKDSLLNLESQKQMNELNTKYESAAKDKELIKKDAEGKRQKILTYFILAVALAVAVIAVLIFRSLKTSNKQKTVIEKQKALVEEKNNDILASIRYAQRIQNALLASDSLLKKYLPEYFILFKPKDIVSGDFYWAHDIASNEGEKFILCTGDCTGHGVPGAFMSLLNMSLLNEAAIERKLAKPNFILDYVRDRVTNSLNKEGKEESKDGMDCSLCVFDFVNKSLEVSCANNPILIAKNGINGYTFEEIKPDKMPVGVYGGNERPFSLQTIALNKGDIIYTFSDGFADQFGGTDGKKFKFRQLQEKLLAVSDKPLAEQQRILGQIFDDWKGKLDQVDDVLVIGVKV